MSFVTKAAAPVTTAAEDLLDFIAESPTMFHSAAAIRARLDAAGFTYLSEGAAWEVRPGGAYYTQRNGSSVVAWRVGERVAAPAFASDVAKATDGVAAGSADVAAGSASDSAPYHFQLTASHVGERVAAPAFASDVAKATDGVAAGSADVAAGSASDSAPYHFQLTASHSDSPCFKVKSNGELEGPAGYVRLDTEAYGGMMDYTWFDRPLSLAGRVLVREGTRIESRLVALNRDVALIPSLAIHMDGGVNKGFAPNRASDLFPLLSAGDLANGSLDMIVADALEIDPAQIVARDLFLVNRERGRVWGVTGEFISSPRLDDLMCAYTSLVAFMNGGNEHTVSVYACFDNEEVGSETKQGAASTLLADTLSRVNAALGFGPEEYVRALSASMLVSCDNAHAQHPAHPELADSLHAPQMNGGIVVKEAANQHYCTDAFGTSTPSRSMRVSTTRRSARKPSRELHRRFWPTLFPA